MSDSTTPNGRLIIFSGAGLSAESGIPTFRGDDGLWENHRIDEVCDYRTWKRHFEKVHAFYDMLRTRLPDHQPNDAHRLIATWQTLFKTILLTQNVDDLLERAGCSDIIHLHGELDYLRCEACGHRWHAEGKPFLPEGRCPKCCSLKGVKPDVIFFHEQAPAYRRLDKTINSLTANDILVSVGTSGSVVPIGQIARLVPCKTILVSLERSAAIEPGDFDVEILEPATTGLLKAQEIITSHLG